MKRVIGGVEGGVKPDAIRFFNDDADAVIIIGGWGSELVLDLDTDGRYANVTRHCHTIEITNVVSAFCALDISLQRESTFAYDGIRGCKDAMLG